MMKNAKSPMDGLVEEVHAWTGISKELLLFHLLEKKDEQLNVLGMTLSKVLKEQEDTNQKNKDKQKRLEVDKKTKELDAFKKRLADLEDKKQSEIAEKVGKYRTSTNEKESVIEQIVRKNIEEMGECTQEKKQFNLIEGDEKIKEKIEKIIEDNVSKYIEDQLNDDQKKKSDESIRKEFYSQITKFNLNNLSFEYEQTLSQMNHKYGKRTLVNILINKEYLPVLLPSMLSDKKAQRVFICFIKTAYNEALIMRLQTGQKQQMKTIKSIIRNVFQYCVKESANSENYKTFISDLLEFDLHQTGKKTLKNMFDLKTSTVLDYFKTEDLVLSELNPFFASLLLDLFLTEGTSFLMTSPSETLFPDLFNFLLYYILAFNADQRSGIIPILYRSILKLLTFLSANLTNLKDSTLTSLVNNYLLYEMVNSVNYDEDDSNQFNNQQKMLLEIHLKLEEMGEILNIESKMHNTQGIVSVKRGKQILKEKEKFNFLKYYTHYEGLEDHQKEQLYQTIETNHYAFNTKVLAKYSMKQIQAFKLKFKENMKMKEFSFIGIGYNPAIEDSIELYSQENIKGDEKQIEIFKNEFYIIYPVIKQIVIAFGDGKEGKLGIDSNSNSLPKACYSTKNIAPKKILSSHLMTAIIDEDDRVFTSGIIKNVTSANQEFKLADGLKDKVRLITVGRSNVTVVTEKNTIFRMGKSLDGHLGLNSSYQNFQKYDQIDEQEQITDKIIDISSGSQFTLFVTEVGKLYCIGNRFLREIGLQSEGVIIQVPLKDDVKVLHCYSSTTNKKQLAIIKVRLENGTEQLWSAGKSDQGLLGQGSPIVSSKIFKPLNYDSSTIKFDQVSMLTDHAMALDTEGNLYGWGSNLQKRAGFKEEILDGIFEPRKITFYLQDNMIPMRISCGSEHSLILFKDLATQNLRLYSIGQTEACGEYLGLNASECKEQVEQQIFYRELTSFREFDIVDIAAGERSSHVIIKGEKTVKENIYVHKIGDQTVQGILHFYKDQQGQLKYVSEKDYASKKSELPDLCLAIKCPIEDLDSHSGFPDLLKLAEDCLDLGSSIHQDVTCDVTHSPIDTPIRYFSYSRLNNDDQKLNLSESAFLQANLYDLNPLVYYRLARPLKAGARLPMLDSKTFFKETADHGIEIEVQPQLEYERNDKIIELTQQEYDELNETIEKFPPEFDSALLKSVNDYIGKSLSDQNVKELKIKDFKIPDMTFKEAKLKKLAEAIKKKRIELYLNFNQFFIKQLKFISMDKKAAGGDMTKQFNQVKKMILFSIKNKSIKQIIETLPTGSKHELQIKRRKAQVFADSGQCDHMGENTIFGQIYQSIKAANVFTCFRQNGSDDRCWRANFAGEGSIDAGGPFRDSITNVCNEIQSDVLPLLIKTVNNRNNHGENRDCFIPNPASNSPTHLELFKFLGYLIGYSIRTQCAFNLNFPPIFWKLLLDEPLTILDLKNIDTYSYKIIDDLQKQGATLSDADFDAFIDERFVTRLSNGTEVELKKGGRQIKVTKENLKEYIDLIVQARFKESENQMRAIIEGVDYVLPIVHLKLFTWDEVEQRGCGDKIVDIEKLKKITSYGSCSDEHEQIKMFWKVLESFTDEERTMYLKFVWGRTRLPYDIEEMSDRHEINYEEYEVDKLPISHTCFFTLDLPKYTTEEICKQRLITAITFCGEIDADRYEVPDEDDS